MARSGGGAALEREREPAVKLTLRPQRPSAWILAPLEFIDKLPHVDVDAAEQRSFRDAILVNNVKREVRGGVTPRDRGPFEERRLLFENTAHRRGDRVRTARDERCREGRWDLQRPRQRARGSVLGW